MKSFRIKSVHLDTARSFIPIKELEQRISEFAALGFTHLQLGLTDDQGWRFESLKYPKLHTLGSHRKRLELTSKISNKQDATPYGGYYTQTELIALVKYARSLSMEIIPLINIPGHSSCAILAYPQLGSGKKVSEVPSIKGRELFKSKSSTLCYTKKFTYQWIQGIYGELMEVFDSEYIHLGFDEICVTECTHCNACDLEALENLLDFTQRLVLSKGRKPIIWWRIERKFNFNLSKFPELILQWWGQTSLYKGETTITNDIIFSQPQNLYFDYPGKVGSRISMLDDMGTQLVQPHTLPDKIARFPDNIIGVGACLWTENLTSEEERSKFLGERLVDLSNILKGVPVPRLKPVLGAWLSSSYISSLVKLIRKANLDKDRLAELELQMDTLTMPELLRYIESEFPEINFRSIPLKKISNSVKGALKRANLTDVEEIEKLYGK